MSASAEQAGRQAENSEWLDIAIRIGLVAYGIVHLMIAFLAIQLALGGGGGSATRKGALAELARDRCHEFLLCVAPLPVTGAGGSPVNPIAIA